MRILLVEDDEILSDTIKEFIVKKYEVEQEYSGEDAYLIARSNIYDLIILDLMLPEMSGYEVLRRLRSEKINTPVLILTAKDGLDDKLKGFDYGADDYLAKPFESKELLARIEAILRRSKKSMDSNILKFKDLTLNLETRQVKVGDEEIALLGKQFDMLEYLLGFKDTIITKEQIFDKIWGFNSETTANVVEVYASGIRKALKKSGYDKYIRTIRGVGYMLTERG
ncbi:MAG: response regulator transcription factor [Clostridia bacterium]|nr:response regulator transcription factor [Clostridia bacterium]